MGKGGIAGESAGTGAWCGGGAPAGAGRGVRGGVARDDGGARCGSEVRDARAATGDAVRRVRDVQVRRGGMLGAVFGTHAAEPARLGGAGRRS